MSLAVPLAHVLVGLVGLAGATSDVHAVSGQEGSPAESAPGSGSEPGAELLRAVRGAPGQEDEDTRASGQEGAPPEVAAAPDEADTTLEKALRRRVAAHPDRLSVEVIGRSPQGRPVWVATLGPPRGGPVPGVLVVPDPLRSGAAPAEVAIALLDRLLAEAESGEDPWLDDLRLYVVPSTMPDRLRAGALHDPMSELPDPRSEPEWMASDVEADFPVEWWPRREGAGAYPLSRPETRALTDFLVEHDDLALVLHERAGPAVGESVPVSAPGSEPAIRAASSALAAACRGAFDVEAFGGIVPRRAGGLPEFCEAYLGLGVLRVTPPDPPADVPPAEVLAAALHELEPHLPRAVLGEPALERLADDLWQVDLAVSNPGLLPSAGPLRSRLLTGSGLRPVVSGGALAAVAERRATEVDHRLVAPVSAGGPVALAPLDVGERRDLRLVVRAEEGARLAIGLTGAGAGAQTATVLLEE